MVAWYVQYVADHLVLCGRPGKKHVVLAGDRVVVESSPTSAKSNHDQPALDQLGLAADPIHD